MGQTTTVVLIMGQESDEQRRLDEVNAWLAKGNPFGRAGMRPGKEYDLDIGRLAWVHDHGGGTRASNMDVAMGSFRHLTSPALFVKFLVEGVKWDEPSAVLVVIQDEDDDAPFGINLGNPTVAIAAARGTWSNDWDWFYNEDGSDKQHTPEEWARYHYGDEWEKHVESFRSAPVPDARPYTFESVDDGELSCGKVYIEVDPTSVNVRRLDPDLENLEL
jgi:hypothetical protein